MTMTIQELIERTANQQPSSITYSGNGVYISYYSGDTVSVTANGTVDKLDIEYASPETGVQIVEG